jgi:acetyltransferase
MAHYLDRLFTPRAIAVFGASPRPDSVGGRVYHNARQARFAGPLYPINPKRSDIDGERCYPELSAVPEQIDLALIATPAATVPEIIHQCGEHGVRAAVVYSAGFGAHGDGARLQKALLEEARRYGIRLLGPNCLGLIRPAAALNATFSNNTALSGPLALVSQSGALCTAILDWATVHKVGFSAVVSLGDAADIDFGDVLDYLALDPETRSILLYVEGIHSARRFMSGLRLAARIKPVVVIKAGRHAEGSRAAMSHTGALVGSDDVFDAALQRAGVVRAVTIAQLFAAAQLLVTHSRIHNNRLAIVTNAGGPGVMATDRAVDLGVKVAELAPPTLAQLDRVLPAHWSHGNPVDILGDATPPRYRAAVDACLEDPGVDGVLVMLTPQAMTDPTEAARAVIEAKGHRDKPVLACWMGEQHVQAGRELFANHGIPEFPNPEGSVEAFAYLANYQQNQQLLLQVPGPLSPHAEPDVEGARLIIEGALAERRNLLTNLEAHALLTAFKIPMMPAFEARAANEALIAAESLGFPVAMKINSRDITHKSDVNGVRLNVANAHAVRGTFNELVTAVRQRRPDAHIEGVTVEAMYRGPRGRELLVGVIRDEVFGPVISFGAGGTTVEVLRDRAVALPPLNSYIARSLIQRTRVSRLLGEFRNLPAVNMDALEQVLLRVSEMVCELPQIRELDINPLIADEKGVVALDARVAVEYQAPSLDRYGHMAIHPYPAHLVSRWQLPDGTNVTIRPIRPEDAEIEQAFVRNLSPETKYFRFMQSVSELTPQMLVRFTQIDYDRELALVAVTVEDDKEVELGVTRYTGLPDGESCEFALVVADAWQTKGIGSRLLTALMEAAKARGYRTMVGEVLETNVHMLDLMRRLGFTLQTDPQDRQLVLVRKAL